MVQTIPTLKQAQMFEVLAKAGQEYTNKPDDPHERQKYLALRILKLAAQCRVSLPVYFLEEQVSTRNSVRACPVGP